MKEIEYIYYLCKPATRNSSSLLFRLVASIYFITFSTRKCGPSCNRAKWDLPEFQLGFCPPQAKNF